MMASAHILQSLCGITQKIKGALETMPGSMHIWQPTPTEWSAHMVLAHLLHCEPFFQQRLACIVRQDNPYLPAFSPKEAVPFADPPFTELLNTFGFTRQRTLAQIYTYTATDWQRPAVHQYTGSTTLKEQIIVLVNHDIAHLGQIYDLRELWLTQFVQRKVSGN